MSRLKSNNSAKQNILCAKFEPNLLLFQNNKTLKLNDK